jgi:uncharacterized protein YjbJ (UPF0337 family)
MRKIIPFAVLATLSIIIPTTPALADTLNSTIINDALDKTSTTGDGGTPTQDVNTGTASQTPTQDVNTGTASQTPTQDVNTGTASQTPTQDVNTGTTSQTPTQDTYTGTTSQTPTQDTYTGTTSQTPTQDANTRVASETATQDTNTGTASQTPTQDTYTGTTSQTPTQDAYTNVTVATYGQGAAANNVKGTIKDSEGNAVADVTLQLHSTGYPQQGYSVEVKNGEFNTYLPAGTYQIDNYYDSRTGNRIILGNTFTVSSEEEPTSVEILAPKKNLTGTLKDNSGNAVADAVLRIHNAAYQQWFDVHIQNGEFNTYLPVGTYQIDSYSDQRTGKEVNLWYTFKVSSEEKPTSVDIVASKENVIGMVKDSSGNAVVDVTLHLHSTGYPQLGYSIEVQNGEFSTYLPAGTYQIDNYYDSRTGNQVILGNTFTVSSEEEPTYVDLVAPKENVVGTLKDNSGNAVSNATLHLHSTGYQQQPFAIRVQNGKFSTFLPVGTYQIDSYNDQTTQTEIILSNTFTVTSEDVPVSADLVAPMENVTGTLKDSSGNAVASATLRFHSTGYTQRWFNVDVRNGKFSTYLPVGTYQVDGYYDQDAQKNFSLNSKFTVLSEEEATSVDLVAPIENVIGTLKDSSGGVVADAMLRLHTTGYQQWFDVHVQNGKFSTYLPVGSYQIDSYYNPAIQKDVFLTKTFKVANETDSISMDLVAPMENVTGTLKDSSGNEVANTMLRLYSTGYPQQSFDVHVQNGKFSTYLPIGVYRVDSYYDQAEQKPSILAKLITVASETEPISLDIVAQKENVTGTVTDSSGNSIDDTWLQLHSIGYQQQTYSVLIRNGKFSTYLPAGTYQIERFSDPQTGNEVILAKTFTVANETDQISLDLTALKENVTGTVKDSSGNAVVDASLQLHGKGTGQQFNVHIRDGKFRTHLPAGIYQIDNYYDQRTENQVFLVNTFIVMNETDQVSLDIVAPKENVAGTVKDSGRNAAVNAWLQMLNTRTQQWFSVRVHNGTFSTNLPAGDYQIENYSDDRTGNQVVLKDSFTVTNVEDITQLTIVLPGQNVTGTLKDCNGNAVSDAWIQVYSTGAEPQTYNVHVQNGEFSTHLPAGDYRIYSYYDDAAQQQVILAKTFTVATETDPVSIDIAAPKENVLGTVKDSCGNLEGDATLELQSRGTEQQWYYVHIKNGVFSTHLPAGDYQINRYIDQRTGNPFILGTEFTVSNEEDSTTVDIVLPKENVTGTVKDRSGNAVVDARLHFHNTAQAFDVHIQNGKFSAYLPEGTYQIDEFDDQITQKQVILAQTFTVSNEGDSTSVDFVLPKENVSGTVKDSSGNRVFDGTLELRRTGNEERWVSVHIQNGKFTTYLPQGTYHMLSYYDEVKQKQVILGKTVIVPETDPITVDIVEPKDNVNGTVKDSSGDAVADAWLQLHSNGTDRLWFNIRIQNGEFSTHLPVGTYQVEGYNDQGTGNQVSLDATFTVSSEEEPTSVDIDASKENILKTDSDTSVRSHQNDHSTPKSTITVVSASQGGMVTQNGATIMIPVAAISGDIKVTVNKLNNISSFSTDSSLKLVSDIFEVTKDVAGPFNKPVSISLPFDKSKVDQARISVSIYWFNEETHRWVQLDNPQVDWNQSMVTGWTKHLTKFAVLSTSHAKWEPSQTINFSDIKGHWAENSITKLIASGVIKGYPNGSFKPDYKITRAEFTSILVNALGLDLKTDKVFKDTAKHWAKDNIATAYVNGIVQEYRKNVFGVDNYITREQMTVMVVKALKLEKANGKINFVDGSTSSPWAKDAILTAVQDGLIVGFPDKTFKPQKFATRAEAVSLIVNALNK